MKLFFCGDVIPGGVLPYQKDYIDSELQTFLNTFDYRIGTLECAVGTNLSYDETKMKGRQNIIYSRNEDFFRMKEMGFDVLSLANNHIWDLGLEGLKNTINLLNENGILYCGAGLNLEEAARPAVIRKDGKTVAVYACCMYDPPQLLGHVEVAGPDKPGVNPLDIERVLSDIQAAKKKYDKVIVMPHWGLEGSYTPIPECIDMAKRMVDAGADVIMGGHTHRPQPCLNIKKTPVCFSMGNFLFPDFYMQPPRPLWYPGPDVDRTQIEEVYIYPFPISKPVKCVSSANGRVGRVFDVTIEKDEVSVQPFFVQLSSDNILSMIPLSRGLEKRLRKEGVMIKYPMTKPLIHAVQRIKGVFK